MKTNYTNMVNDLLGDELYGQFIKEISKEKKGGNLIDFGNEVIEKCCLLIIMLGMSKVKLDNIKLCVGDEIKEINCREFAKKYEKYLTEIEMNLSRTLRNV